jgi:hypothetical protein
MEQVDRRHIDLEDRPPFVLGVVSQWGRWRAQQTGGVDCDVEDAAPVIDGGGYCGASTGGGEIGRNGNDVSIPGQ